MVRDKVRTADHRTEDSGTLNYSDLLVLSRIAKKYAKMQNEHADLLF